MVYFEITVKFHGVICFVNDRLGSLTISGMNGCFCLDRLPEVFAYLAARPDVTEVTVTMHSDYVYN